MIIVHIYSSFAYAMKSVRLLESWGSEATPLATHLFKRSDKISHPPWLWVSLDPLPSFVTLLKSAKIALSKKIFYIKNHSNIFSIKGLGAHF